MDGLQALQAGTVRPPEGKPAASEGTDGEVRGSRSSLVRMRDMDPPEVPLRQAPYNTPQDVASNPGILVQVAKQAHPLIQIEALQRTQCESIETTVRTRRLLWAGALLRMGDHRLPKRVMSGELENAGKRGPGGRRKIGRTAWQMIFGYLASRGTGEPPHLTLGRGITRYTKEVVGIWPRKEDTPNQRQKKREAEETDKVEVTPGVTVANLRRFRTALIGPTQRLPKRRRLCR